MFVFVELVGRACNETCIGVISRRMVKELNLIVYNELSGFIHLPGVGNHFYSIMLCGVCL